MNFFSHTFWVKASIICAFTLLFLAAMRGDVECAYWCNAYYHFTALGVFFYVLAFTLVILYGTPKLSKNWIIFILLNLLCTATGVGDEIAGQAEVINWYDLVRYVVPIVVFIFFNLGRKWKIF